ncbi:MAG TPA: 50S ribosomal protein L11 methyltransferase [Candidatus Methylomirabilis sp.]|nr:50S ribosomal protein L11 methyltransferase [Candidatus Methylomirabilis sp.]
MIWLYLIVFIFGLSFLYGAYRAAPFLPMHAADVERVIKLAELKPGEKFFDLGCGEGRTLIAAARVGAEATGYEISLLPYIWAKIKILFYRGPNKSKVFFRDFWKINLGEADVVYNFLMPRVMAKLREKLKKELKPGARVINYTFYLPDWNPEKIDDIPGRPKIYLYRK